MEEYVNNMCEISYTKNVDMVCYMLAEVSLKFLIFFIKPILLSLSIFFLYTVIVYMHIISYLKKTDTIK